MASSHEASAPVPPSSSRPPTLLDAAARSGCGGKVRNPSKVRTSRVNATSAALSLPPASEPEGPPQARSCAAAAGSAPACAPWAAGASVADDGLAAEPWASSSASRLAPLPSGPRVVHACPGGCAASYSTRLRGCDDAIDGMAPNARIQCAAPCRVRRDPHALSWPPRLSMLRPGAWGPLHVEKMCEATGGAARPHTRRSIRSRRDRVANTIAVCLLGMPGGSITLVTHPMLTRDGGGCDAVWMEQPATSSCARVWSRARLPFMRAAPTVDEPATSIATLAVPCASICICEMRAGSRDRPSKRACFAACLRRMRRSMRKSSGACWRGASRCVAQWGPGVMPRKASRTASRSAVRSTTTASRWRDAGASLRRVTASMAKKCSLIDILGLRLRACFCMRASSAGLTTASCGTASHSQAAANTASTSAWSWITPCITCSQHYPPL
eukprot:scaffold25016_cov129-Isochrysis_galbana.AAC.2